MVIEVFVVYDDGWNVMVGDFDLLVIFYKVGIECVVFVVVIGFDVEMVYVVFMVCEIEQDVFIVGFVNYEDFIDVFEFVGCIEVIYFVDCFGDVFVCCVCLVYFICYVIGSFDDFLIVEVIVSQLLWVGLLLKDVEICWWIGVLVVGIWEQGSYKLLILDMVFGECIILLFVGICDQFDLYDLSFFVYFVDGDMLLLIVGGGCVGCVVLCVFECVGIFWCIVEIVFECVCFGDDCYFFGSGVDCEFIECVGLFKILSVFVIMYDDDFNVFLVFYYCKLRLDVQILSWVLWDCNVEMLYCVGVDFVFFYVLMGVIVIFDYFD